jgi:hypothetical protein
MQALSLRSPLFSIFKVLGFKVLLKSFDDLGVFGAFVGFGSILAKIGLLTA